MRPTGSVDFEDQQAGRDGKLWTEFGIREDIYWGHRFGVLPSLI